VLGLTLARKTASALSAQVRVPSFAIWETATMVLNVLAFTLIGLQIGPTPTVSLNRYGEQFRFFGWRFRLCWRFRLYGS